MEGMGCLHVCFSVMSEVLMVSQLCYVLSCCDSLAEGLEKLGFLEWAANRPRADATEVILRVSASMSGCWNSVHPVNSADLRDKGDGHSQSNPPSRTKFM